MNNISQISKAKRLTEEEVHAAAEELHLDGKKVGSIEVYRFLGRGSLTTITNFLKTWHQEEKATTPPALIMLPEALKKSAEQLIAKVWAESPPLAEQEITTQQEALRQAEALANEKIAEAEAFSEEQAAQIEALEALEALEAQIEELRKEKAKDHEYFLTEEKRLQTKINNFQKGEGILETRIFNTEKQLINATAEIGELKKMNVTLAAENIALKTRLEGNEVKLKESENNLKKAEEKAMNLEAANKVQSNQIDQLAINLKDQKEITAMEANDNKVLREKASKLEGELIAWKEIKPESQKEDTGRNVANRNNLKAKTATASKKEYKQTEWTK